MKKLWLFSWLTVEDISNGLILTLIAIMININDKQVIVIRIWIIIMWENEIKSVQKGHVTSQWNAPVTL